MHGKLRIFDVGIHKNLGNLRKLLIPAAMTKTAGCPIEGTNPRSLQTGSNSVDIGVAERTGPIPVEKYYVKEHRPSLHGRCAGPKAHFHEERIFRLTEASWWAKHAQTRMKCSTNGHMTRSRETKCHADAWATPVPPSRSRGEEV